MSSVSSFAGGSDKENQDNTPRSSTTSLASASKHKLGDASDQLIRSKKRVVFSPLPHFLQPSAESQPGSNQPPRKSVLKQSSVSPTPSPSQEIKNPHDVDLLLMLESAIASLRGNDRHSKFDTYATLLNLFRAFENVPDRARLFPKLTELFTLILADVQRREEEDDSKPDYTLNTKALKVIGFLLYDSQISAAIPKVLSRALIEHSLTRLEASHISKATASQFLWLWQTQRLPAGVITNDLAERMLTAVNTIHFPSVVINQEKMGVLVRLLDQNRECMIKHAESWLPRVINNMLDENRQIRDSALKTALEAGKHLCNEPTIGRCVQAHLRSQINGTSFIELTAQRFVSLMKNDEGGIFIAHAWGAVCTLSSSQNPEKSKTLMDWMHVLSLVFNSPSTQNKVMAQSAWVRMVHYFANNGSVLYRPKNMSYLLKPMTRMLTRESKVYDTVRMAAVNTLCALLYSLCQPLNKHEDVELTWEQVLLPTITLMLEGHQKEALRQRGVEILICLLDPRQVSAWSLDRLLDPKVFTEAEIHALDCRWVRTNSSKVLDLVLVVLQAQVSRESKLKLWQAYLNSIQAAAAKEVRITSEATDAIATICTALRTIWQSEPSSFGDNHIQLVSDLANAAFDALGHKNFTERCLSAEFRVSPESSIENKGAISPLVFLMQLFQDPIKAVAADEKYVEIMEQTLQRALTSKTSIGKCFETLTDCLSCVPRAKAMLPTQSWKILADIAQTALRHNTSDAREVVDQWPAVKELLDFGLHLQVASPMPEWENLASAFVQHFQKVGETNIQPAEALSQALLSTECHQVTYVSVVLELAQPCSATPKRQARNQFPFTLKLLHERLLHMHKRWRCYKLNEDYNELITNATAFLQRIPANGISLTLESLAQSIIPMAVRSDEPVAEAFVITALQVSQYCDNSNINLLIAGFSSPSVVVRDAAVQTWNATYGKRRSVSYSTELVKAIQSMELVPGTMSLPTWPIDDDVTLDITEMSLHADVPKMASLEPVTSSQQIKSEDQVSLMTSDRENRKRKRQERKSGLSDPDTTLLQGSSTRTSSPRKRQKSVQPADDVFGSNEMSELTLHKRELREVSPQPASDPISESSPSVMSRMRKMSYSSSPRDRMAEIRDTARSLTPAADDQTGSIMNLPEPMAPDRILSAPTMPPDLPEDEVDDDEDLFILQLQQYRASLNEGKPVTPRRRAKLGLLLRDLASLNSAVTAAYFEHSI